MKNRLHFVQNIASGQEITTTEQGHSFLQCGFSFAYTGGSLIFIGFLSYLFPILILSRMIQRGGQQTVCLIKNVCAMIQLSSQDLQRRLKADAKNRNIVLVNRYF